MRYRTIHILAKSGMRRILKRGPNLILTLKLSSSKYLKANIRLRLKHIIYFKKQLLTLTINSRILMEEYLRMNLSRFSLNFGKIFVEV
jgi:hypothetical protein